MIDFIDVENARSVLRDIPETSVNIVKISALNQMVLFALTEVIAHITNVSAGKVGLEKLVLASMILRTV